MSEDIVITVDLLRHGAPEGGIRYRGSLDDPLSEQGWQQMRSAVSARPPWDVIVSSPLRRCAAFASELSERHQLIMEIESDFREINFGAWEGHSPVEISAATPNALTLFWRDPVNHPPPRGESLVDFSTRVMAAWQSMMERHSGRHVVVITHGGVIRALLCHILEMPLSRIWRLEVPYATFSRVRVHGSGAERHPVLVFHGKGLE